MLCVSKQSLNSRTPPNDDVYAMIYFLHYVYLLHKFKITI